MRLIARTLYRAFPELDPYDDEQCLRFVKAARGSFLRRALHVSIIILVLLPLFVGAIYIAAMLSDYFDLFNHGKVGFALILNTLLWMAGTACVLAVPLLSAYYLRDFLLSRRLKTVLRTRGACPACNYSVVGLAVVTGDTGKSFVTCPECGVKVEVDPALAVLTREGVAAVGDAAGVATGRVFVGGQVVDAAVFWTPRRRRFVKRTSIALALLVIVGGGLTVGINELLVHRDAARAAADMAYLQKDFDSIAEAMDRAVWHPSAAPGAAGNAWDSFDRAQRLLDATDDRVWRPLPTQFGSTTLVPDFTLVYSPEEVERNAFGDPESNRDSASLARVLIDLYRADGVYDASAAIPHAASALAPSSLLDPMNTGPSFTASLGPVRAMLRVQGARMTLAAERGDHGDFIASVEEAAALSRLCASQPLQISTLIAVACDAFLAARLRNWILSDRFDPSWVPLLRDALRRQSYSPQFALMLDSERLFARAYLASFFKMPDNIRLGTWSKQFRILTNNNQPFSLRTIFPEKRLGFYRQNTDAVDAGFRAGAPAWDADPWRR
jgi:hypothetical protein